MKKIIKFVIAVIVLLIVAAFAVLFVLSNHPNLFLKIASKEIKEGQTVKVTYKYDSEDIFKSEDLPLYSFTPAEDASYSFTAENIRCTEDATLLMSVTDEEFEDYVTVENTSGENDMPADAMTGSAPLQKGKTCYIMFSNEIWAEYSNSYSGSFRLTVTKEEQAAEPPELKPGEHVSIAITPEGQNCAVFTPAEDGYYRFSTSIGSEDAALGYSAISSITADDKRKIPVTNGIARLEKGKKYYVWAVVNDDKSRHPDVEISCSSMKSVSGAGKGTLNIDGETVIEYVSGADENIAVYSVSSGNPYAVIYETAGFPLRTDGDSDGLLSGNNKDFDTVFAAEKGKLYRICVYGDLKDCQVRIAKYIGDGTTLTPDDIEENENPADTTVPDAENTTEDTEGESKNEQ